MSMGFPDEAKREIKALRERVEKLEEVVGQLVKIMLAEHGATPPSSAA